MRASSLLLAALLLPASLPAAWETVTVDGHDYVTLRSVKAFYKFDTMKVTDTTIVLENKVVKAVFPLEGTAALFNTVKLHLEFPLVKHEDAFLLSRITLSKTIDPVFRPGYINKDAIESFSTIVLDPEPMPGLDDDDLTHEIAAAAKEKLEKRNFKVVLSRKKNERPGLEERLAAHNELDHAIVISLRLIDDKKPIEGLRTWILAPIGAAAFGEALKEEHLEESPGNAHDSMNIALATALHSTALVKIRRPDRGVARSRAPLLADSNHPAVLVEVGNLSHESDAKLLKSGNFQQAVADSIAAGLVKTRLATSRFLRAAPKAPPKPEE